MKNFKKYIQIIQEMNQESQSIDFKEKRIRRDFQIKPARNRRPDNFEFYYRKKFRKFIMLKSFLSFHRWCFIHYPRLRLRNTRDDKL